MKQITDYRIDALHTVLLWEGEVDNQRIRELFGVGPVWASRLLAELAKRLGKDANRATAYAPLRLTARAIGQRRKHSPDEYLTIVGAHTGSVSGTDLFEDARKDLSSISAEVFSAVVKAMREQVGLSICYRSMSQPEGAVRLVFPHALVRAPRRWHMRAWCEERQEFRDFNLGRIASATRDQLESTHRRADDQEWTELVKFSVIAHPALSLAQQAMIAAEYYPNASARQLTIRRCLLGYTLQDLRLATDATLHKPPDYQLLVHDAHKLPPTFALT